MPPFSLSLPFTWCITHGIHTPSHSGPHGGATGGNRLILGRYDLLSIQARLSLFAPRWRRLLQPVEQRTQAALGAFKQADPAWIQPPPKMAQKSGAARTPTVWKSPPFFSALIYLRCRPRRMRPSSCCLQLALLFSRRSAMRER